MDKFLVLYKAPIAVIDEWMKKPEQERKSDETKMMDAWKKWMSANASKFTDKGAGAGKPKVVSSSGVKDVRNDIMMYQIVQAQTWLMTRRRCSWTIRISASRRRQSR